MGIPAVVVYEQQWQDYKRRRNLLAFAFIAYVPVVGTFGYLTTRFLHTEVPFYVFASCWMVFFAFSGIRFQLFRCPRCGKRFFLKSLYRNPLANRCLHCALPKYSGSAGNQ